MHRRTVAVASGFALAAFIAGCAPKSSDLQAFHVPDKYYDTLDCKEVEAEYARVTSRVIVIGQARDDYEGRRMAAIILLGILVGPVVIPEDHAAANEVRSLKGEAQSLERVAQKKGCPLATRIAAQKEEIRNPEPVKPAESVFSLPISAEAEAAKKEPRRMTAAERMELQAGPGYRNYPRQSSSYD